MHCACSTGLLRPFLNTGDPRTACAGEPRRAEPPPSLLVPPQTHSCPAFGPGESRMPRSSFLTQAPVILTPGGPRLLDSGETERAPPQKAVAGVERRQPCVPNFSRPRDPDRTAQNRSSPSQLRQIMVSASPFCKRTPAVSSNQPAVHLVQK